MLGSLVAGLLVFTSIVLARRGRTTSAGSVDPQDGVGLHTVNNISAITLTRFSGHKHPRKLPMQTLRSDPFPAWLRQPTSRVPYDHQLLAAPALSSYRSSHVNGCKR
jgi:hypothetical protein